MEILSLQKHRASFTRKIAHTFANNELDVAQRRKHASRDVVEQAAVKRPQPRIIGVKCNRHARLG
jgi:hypothetical protein